MTKTKLQIWAEGAAASRGFKPDKVIYQGEYYSARHVRNVIISGEYRGRAAVLKAYDDPRLSDEPLALKRFNEGNKSETLIAPALYDYEMLSPKKGWLIMEKLPEGSFFNSPLNKEERQPFIKAFLEYRRNFPFEPTRPLTLAEKLPAAEFHLLRINKWFILANDKEEEIASQGGEKALRADTFIPQYVVALEFIRRAFRDRRMIWCHGHVKPKEIFRPAKGAPMYLTDFAHAKMYPEGYELAFIIWADYLLAADWQVPYGQWREGVFSWMEELKDVAEELAIADYNSFIKACLAERILGSILADVCASERPLAEKRARIGLFMNLLREML